MPHNSKLQDSHKRQLSYWHPTCLLIKHITNIIPLLFILIRKCSLRLSHDAVTEKPSSYRAALWRVYWVQFAVQKLQLEELFSTDLAFTGKEILGASFHKENINQFT